VNYGRAIRILRAARGLSQQDLAAKTGGLSSSMLSLIESGKREPSVDAVLMLTGALDTDVVVLHALGLDDIDDHGVARYVLKNLLNQAPKSDPIAAAVDAHLDPLKDELIAMGHKLAKSSCKVREAGMTDPPQDCDWPFCGCDEHATKVIDTLQECGWGPR
jgi:transcriptional regulator with XRE-family HTH domain